MKDCVFCRIMYDGLPARIHYSDDNCVVIHPLNPVTEGHLLVIPRQHVVDALDNPDVTAMAMKTAAMVAKVIGGSFNLITSVGKPATQSIFHLHIHIVPRWNDDGLYLPWTNQIVKQ